jgi:hypothetical protein
LRAATGTRGHIERTSVASFLLTLIASESWDAIIIDPEMVLDIELSELINQLSNCSHPLIIYTALSHVSASMIAALSAHCLAGVILRDYDDSPDLLRNALTRLPIEFYGVQILERIAENVDCLPASLRRATTAAFCSAKLIRSPVEYAHLSGFSRRSVDRWLHRVGLRQAKRIVSAAQFLRALPLIQSPRIPFSAITRAAGYSSVRTLAHHAIALTGSELANLRTNANRVDIIPVLTNALLI